MANIVSIGRTKKVLTVYPRHDHAVWEIVLYVFGTGTATSADRSIPFTVGTLIVNPPHIAHSEHAPGGYENIVLSVKRAPFSAEAATVIQDAEHAPVRSIMELMRREYMLARSTSADACDELAGVLFSYIASLAQSERNVAVERVENILIEHIQDAAFRVEEALANGPLSRFHFMKVFKKATGRSPRQYLIDLRLRAAVNLLSTTDMPVQEVARQSGFDDAFYFSRLFSRRMGKSPAGYRARSV